MIVTGLCLLQRMVVDSSKLGMFLPPKTAVMWTKQDMVFYGIGTSVVRRFMRAFTTKNLSGVKQVGCVGASL